jgi:nicotinamidase/pyrazinamidase
MSQKFTLLIIDPQIDFCDPAGALYVPNAEHDMRRLAEFIRKQKALIETIHVTLDSHHLVHIAHPIFWQDSAGKNPSPFSTITAAEVEEGRWITSNPELQTEGLNYVRKLEKNGRYSLTIWPPHCLIGSRGQAVQPDLFEALLEWESDFKTVQYWNKGSYALTEHFSALQADVPFLSVPETLLNQKLLTQIEQSELILIAGEARTHCVASTVRDLADNFSDPASIKKMVLLQNAMSDIPGFEKYAEDFLQEMQNRGCRISTTETFRN